jgi:tetratricopeptide (TPR) repeat protein
MKKIIGTLAIYASLAIVALASFANVSELRAQTPAPAPAQTPAVAQTTCTDEVKTPLYADFTKFRIPDAGKAYEAAKKYLAACSTDVAAQAKVLRERLAKTDLPAKERTDAEAELKGLVAVPNYLEKWTAQYDKDARKIKLTNLFVGQRKYAEAMPVAKEVLADEPDNLTALIALGYGGYALAVSTKNESGNAEAINYAKKAIEAIESGKAPENWTLFKSKDDALGYLYYSVGFLERVTNPGDALKNFIKAAQFESDIKKNSQTYAFIANAYEEEYAKQSAAYLVYTDKPETPESKLAAENINQLVDRIIDALARAVAVAGSDANAQAAKAPWLARLTDLYKFRHNKSDAGLNEMIASVMSKPLPPVPTPITTLPAAPAATATPAPGSDTSAAGSTMAPGAAAPPATNRTTTTTAVSPAAATAPKTTTTSVATASTKAPVKPKTRNNHRRH